MLALRDTTGRDVVRKLAAERRSAGGVASGLALTLVAVTDEGRVREVEDAATFAAAEHPCRLLIVVRDGHPGPDAASRLDAEIVVGGRLGPCEAVVLRMRGRLALHAESVVVPLLAPDVPVVTWWHGPPPGRIAYDPLGVVAERRITDTAQCPNPVAALHQRAEDYAPGDTDLAWTRLTPWRTLVAGAFDTTSALVTGVTVAAPQTDPSGALLGGWLHARLGVQPALHPTAMPAADGVPADRLRADGLPADALRAVELQLDDGTQLSLVRHGGTAVLHHTGQADRVLPLVRRRLGEELAEELRRLDADQPYAAALGAATGLTGLDGRPRTRVHIWQDPALAEDPDTGCVPR
ncbi:MAG TPA: glucose-6-phosphate dehydrogenase assembly protein OpcA [Micromonosporaceae bacterium]|nr:glucose-6-phosphate dehydrogenase assembly protein OpcA [Micromonosporaceae bacterium]